MRPIGRRHAGLARGVSGVLGLVATIVLLCACGGGDGARPRAAPVRPSEPTAGRAGGRDARFVVRWVRRARAGTRWDEQVERRVERTVVRHGVNGPPRTETTEHTVRFDAVAQVLADGATREVVRYTLSRFERVTGRAHRELLRPGAVLEIAREIGRGWVTRDGAPVEGGSLAELAEVLDVGLSPPELDDDSLLGTRAQLAVGARWAPDVRALARALRQPVERLRSEARLLERTQLEGVACLRVRWIVEVADGAVVPDLPPQSTLESASLHLEGEAWLPLDPSLPALRSTRLTREAHVLVEARARVESSTVRTTREQRHLRAASHGLPPEPPRR